MGRLSTEIIAPTPLASRTCPRSPARPSERSMAAWARPRSPMPVRSRGVGRSRRTRSQPSSGVWNDPASDRARPSAASPRVPVTQTRSPTCAPSRRSAAPAGTKPMAVIVMLKGPRVVSPPTRQIPDCCASCCRPPANAVSHSSSASGKVKASRNQRGSAPIAARSERLTASDFQPISAGLVGYGKCRPATSVSVVIASACPGAGRTSAQSSPMPSATLSAGGDSAAK